MDTGHIGKRRKFKINIRNRIVMIRFFYICQMTEQPDTQLRNYFNQILDLQISIVEGYKTVIKQGDHLPDALMQQLQDSFQQRRSFAEEIRFFIIDLGSKIDKRTGVVATPHDVTGDNHQPTSKGFAELNQELIALYESILKHPDLQPGERDMLHRQVKAVGNDRELIRQLVNLS